MKTITVNEMVRYWNYDNERFEFYKGDPLTVDIDNNPYSMSMRSSIPMGKKVVKVPVLQVRIFGFKLFTYSKDEEVTNYEVMYNNYKTRSLKDGLMTDEPLVPKSVASLR